ncbi:ATP-binding protein [Planobispora siamensis]|uniref:Histidine kinase/HSP90-like ATPase domain-containing protein n=1 Tax=Planobispora siamensis TaxID=936338 RepID=A0A8J3SIS4_9ACTN|nr:ATP-binding protein [Planobispora siamensis]GIH95062.1 hypothetical protein Psi01_56920 [Planobispora siamensis]
MIAYTVTTWEFTQEKINTVRGAVTDYASAHGLKGVRRGDFVLAVYEAMTNVVKHAGGRGLIRMWAVGGLLICDITDSGPGIPVTSFDGDDPPSDHAPGGRGIWLIRRLSDSADFTTGPQGTTLRIAFRLDGPPPDGLRVPA